MLWICNYVSIMKCDTEKQTKQTKQAKDVCFPTGLYSMTEVEIKVYKILSSISSCLYFVPVIICMSVKRSCKVLLFLYRGCICIIFI